METDSRQNVKYQQRNLRGQKRIEFGKCFIFWLIYNVYLFIRLFPQKETNIIFELSAWPDPKLGWRPEVVGCNVYWRRRRISVSSAFQFLQSWLSSQSYSSETTRETREGLPLLTVELRWMETQRGQMKGVLSWLVRWACHAGTRDFCSAFAALYGPV